MVFIVVMIARQIDGEMVFVRMQKAFKEKTKAEAMLQELMAIHGKNGGQTPVMITTPHGDVECHYELGVFEIELE